MNEEDWDIIDSSVREWAAPQEQEQQARDAVIIRGVLGFSPERRSNGLAAQDAQFTQALSPGWARAPLGSCPTSHQPSILMRSGSLPKSAGSLQMPKSPISTVPFANSR